MGEVRQSRGLWAALALLYVGAFAPVPCLADGLEGVSVTQVQVGTERIGGLVWSQKIPALRLDPDTEERGPRILVLVEGIFQRQDWTLIVESRPLPRDIEGRFRFWYPLTAANTGLDVIAIGPFGQVEKERISFQTRGFQFWSPFAPLEDSTSVGKLNLVHISPGLGMSILGYRQSDVPDVDQIVLTGKFSAVHVLSPSWDIGLSGYLTLAPLITGSSDTARFLGLNARIGYTLPFSKPPWKMAILAGWYFTTMFVASGDFGFRNMAGPQLFPSLRYSFPDGASAWTYAKFSPVTDGSSLSFENRELAFGGGYGFKPIGGRAFSVTIDIAELALQVGADSISSNSFSIGMGLSL